MRKHFLLLLCACAVFWMGLAPVFAGGKAESTTAPTKKTFTFMTWDSEFPGVSYKTHTDIGDQALEKLTGVHIVYDVIPNEEYPTVQQLRLASGQKLDDFVTIYGGQDGSYLVRYYNDKVIIRLNELLPKNAPGFTKLLEDKDFKDQILLPDGSFVAFSGYNRSRYMTGTIAVRLDWLQKLGLPIPKTTDDLYNVAKAFVNNDPDGNGKKDTQGFSCTYDGWTLRQLGMSFGLALATGGGWTVRDGKVIFGFVDPAYRAFLEYMHRAYAEGLVASDYLSGKLEDHLADITRGRIGIESRIWMPDLLQLNNPDSMMVKTQPTAAWIPVVITSSFGKFAAVSEPVAQRWRTVAISSSCKDPAGALAYWDFAALSPQGKIISNYGIEGKTFDMVNGFPVARQVSEYTLGKGEMYNFIRWGQYNDDASNSGPFKADWFQKLPLYKTINQQFETMLAACYPGFVGPIPTPDQGTRFAGIQADLETYTDEMMAKFITGQLELNDASWNDYVQKCNSLGVNEILTSYNKK